MHSITFANIIIVNERRRIMFCGKCGFELNKTDTNFCPRCGRKVEIIEDSYHMDNQQKHSSLPNPVPRPTYESSAPNAQLIKKPLVKKWWLWAIIAVGLAILALGSIIVINKIINPYDSKAIDNMVEKSLLEVKDSISIVAIPPTSIEWEITNNLTPGNAKAVDGNEKTGQKKIGKLFTFHSNELGFAIETTSGKYNGNGGMIVIEGIRVNSRFNDEEQYRYDPMKTVICSLMGQMGYEYDFDSEIFSPEIERILSAYYDCLANKEKFNNIIEFDDDKVTHCHGRVIISSKTYGYKPLDGCSTFNITFWFD